MKGRKVEKKIQEKEHMGKRSCHTYESRCLENRRKEKRISKKEEENIFPAGLNLGFFGRG